MLFTKNMHFPIAALKYIVQLDMCHNRFDVNGINLTIVSNYWFKNNGDTHEKHWKLWVWNKLNNKKIIYIYIYIVLDLWVQLMKNGGKNKSVAFIIFVSIYIYIYTYIIIFVLFNFQTHSFQCFFICLLFYFVLESFIIIILFSKI